MRDDFFFFSFVLVGKRDRFSFSLGQNFLFLHLFFCLYFFQFFFSAFFPSFFLGHGVSLIWSRYRNRIGALVDENAFKWVLNVLSGGF